MPCPCLPDSSGSRSPSGSVFVSGPRRTSCRGAFLAAWQPALPYLRPTDMAGHSHSANIKFRKDRVDSKRAKIFSKLSRMITVAAKLGGGQIDANPRLRLAVDKARANSMPKDAIERAVKKGTGEGDAGNYEEILYEGYGAGGVAIMLEILTDNRNRTAPEVRKMFESHGGNLGTTGAVAWMFERRGAFDVDPAGLAPEGAMTEEQLLEVALEAGAQDVVEEEGAFTIYCDPSDFGDVSGALQQSAVPLRGAAIAYVASQRTQVADAAVARRVARLLDALDDHDDVQGLHSNEDFSDEVMQALAADE
jgi:YebC/PmpR family DNA-binding regulatory protein